MFYHKFEERSKNYHLIPLCFETHFFFPKCVMVSEPLAIFIDNIKINLVCVKDILHLKKFAKTVECITIIASGVVAILFRKLAPKKKIFYILSEHKGKK
jgi:hypothetical protein